MKPRIGPDVPFSLDDSRVARDRAASDILFGAGFLIRRLREPRPSADAVRKIPTLEDGLRLPSFLIFDAIKPRSPGTRVDPD